MLVDAALWHTSVRHGQVGQTTMYQALAVLDLIRMACEGGSKSTHKDLADEPGSVWLLRGGGKRENTDRPDGGR